MKRILYLAITFILMLVSIIFVDNIFSQLKEQNINIQLASDQAEIYRIQAYMNEKLDAIEGDSLTISMLLKENVYNDVSAASKSQDNYINILKKTLPSFFKSSKLYTKIAYINKDGKEIIKVDKNGVNTEAAYLNETEKEQLVIASKNQSGTLHASFDGKTLYFFSPIYDDNGAFSGVILLTTLRDSLLDGLGFNSNDDDTILIDSSGNYIYSHSSKPTGTFISDYSKDLFDSIKSKEFAYEDTPNGTLLTHLPIKIEDETWYLILKANKQEINSHSTNLQSELTGGILVIIGFIIALILLWGSSYKKAQYAEKLKEKNKQLEELNTELYNKQFQLEEQNAMVEELNAQLEEESERYQHQKDTLQAIIESTGEGILMIDTYGEITFLNNRWQKIFNHFIDINKRINTVEYLKAMLSSINASDKYLPKLKEIMNDYNEELTIDLEQTVPKKKDIHLYSVPCLSTEGNPLGRIFVCRDVTRLKEVDRLKSELISTVSHELRTPMSSIMGFSELLLTRKLSEERSKGYIEIIYKESHRLTNLINDFLDIQRIENGKQVFDKKNASFNTILNNAMELFKNVDHKYNIIHDSIIEGNLEVYCDTDKIVQVISNLLSNAVKYSPNGGDIIIKAITEGKMLKVSIEDHGLGIPEEVKGNLFTKFFRVINDDRREIGGTGLGLAICKEIIEAHGGKIGVDSTYGSGSTFYFSIPLYENKVIKPKVSKDEIQDRSISNNAILIVEDDESFAKLIEDILKNDGFETYAVNNGEEALKLVNDVNPKAIILDIVLLGKLNGWDVLKELKDSSKTENIPVIISSIYDNEGKINKKGPLEYLKKPFESNQLLTALHKVMMKDLDPNAINSENYIVNSLIRSGVRVKGSQKHDDVIIITLDGEKKNESK